ncbi:hypothetical protein G3570_00040 [Balneolaceae bacterium YR4-1]|uniref:Long-chain fatty acid transport protein n=1 Tax=Halalkalibaculum roseum TaxID=2709311 RepID=A0A6M1T3R1_9BACT|nr:hypothetical protein [Halalkalibaculum roseum]NGP75003.1 hypothetical protein [Halalkalibaculum roseum]
MKKGTIIFALLVGMLIPIRAGAQLINLKTAPVATGDQFLVHPAVNIGMGNVSIAQDDTLGDTFINPATAVRVKGTKVFMLPAFYRISNGNGSAKTLTLGGLTSSGNWFGGVGIAIQDMSQASGRSNLLKDESTNNNYFWVQGGTQLSEKTSLGARFYWASLGAMDGVDLLYPRSRRIEQDGYMLDARLGLLMETGNRGEFEALLLYSRTDMTHEVFYDDFITFWNVNSLTTTDFAGQLRVEENLDKTNTLGMHLGYNQAVGDDDWKLGGIFTMNYKTHPKIPNYELMNIPRDPGNTWAFDVGIGASHTSEDDIRFGADLIIEPIWSNTWVEAQQNILDPEGTTVLVAEGEKTIENDFAFFNSAIKTGLGWRGEHMLWEGGIRAKTFRYRLKQWNYIQQSFRRQREHWTEWTFSMSVGAFLKDIAIKYTGLLTYGTGQPGTNNVVWGPQFFAANAAGDFIFAPDGDLMLDDATVLTHQFTIMVPF